MTKRVRNRAQRRFEQRKQIKYQPGFFETVAGKVTLALIGAVILASVAYQFWPKPTAAATAAPTPSPAAATTSTPPATPQPPTPPANPDAKLESKDTKVGTGEEAKTGDTVTVQYTGTLTNGTKFDSSYDHNKPFTFTLGQGSVIKGWDQGVVGMKVGGKRQLSIPPELGYGPQAKPGIPANSTLNFDIELVKVEHPTSTGTPAPKQ